MAKRDFKTDKPEKMKTVKLFYDTDECEGEFVQLVEGGGIKAVNVGPVVETEDSWVYRSPNEIDEWDDVPSSNDKKKSNKRCLMSLDDQI